MAHSLPSMLLRVTDANGTVLPGALLHVYLAGTLTETPVYTTAALDVEHENPVEADSGGLLPAIFFAPGDYKLVYATAADVEVGQRDNYTVVTDGAEINFPVFSKTANFSVTSTDRGAVFLVDASAAPGLTINCSADSDELGSGFPFTVVNVGATGTVTVLGDGAQTVSGSADLDITTQNSAVSFVSIGATGWQVTGRDGVSATTTDTLTGTSTTLAVTPNALAALWEKGTSVAGGSTLTLDEGGLFLISGAGPWTCTDVDFTVAKDGRSARLVSAGVGTFTHSSTLVCPGSRDVKMRAGDSVIVTQYDGDTIHVSDHRPVNYDTEGMVKLQEQNASSSATIDFNFSAWPEFTHFTIVGSGIIPATDNVEFRALTATDSAPTYETGASDYWCYLSGYATGSSRSDLGVAAIELNNSTVFLGNAANESYNFSLFVRDPHDTAVNTSMDVTINYRSASSAGIMHFVGSAGRAANQDTTYIRFSMSAGNITSGKFIMYGHR